MSSKSWIDRLPAVDPNMFKRSFYTVITPLPDAVTRETAVGVLHDHGTMIELNPLVIAHGLTSAPSNATEEEKMYMKWYEIRDSIQYIPGTTMKHEVTYKGGFYDLPMGLQTHVFAPGGVDIQAKWRVGGNMPGEPREPMEIGVDKPREGLYLREDVDVKCNVIFSSFVKRNMKKNHAILVKRLLKRVGVLQDQSMQLDRPSTFRSSASDPTLSSRGSTSMEILSPAYTTSDSPSSPGPPRRVGTLCICTWTSGGGQTHLIACPYYSRLYIPPKLVTPAQTSSSTTPYTAPVEGPSPAHSWDVTPTSHYAAAFGSRTHQGQRSVSRPVSEISALDGDDFDIVAMQDRRVSTVTDMETSAINDASPIDHEAQRYNSEQFTQDRENNPDSARQYYKFQDREADLRSPR